LSAFAGNLCAVSAAQPLTEDQARSVIAPWYSLWRRSRRREADTDAFALRASNKLPFVGGPVERAGFVA